MYISGYESGCRLLNSIKDLGRAESDTGGKSTTKMHMWTASRKADTEGGSIWEEGREGKVRGKLKINVKNIIMNCKFK